MTQGSPLARFGPWGLSRGRVATTRNESADSAMPMATARDSTTLRPLSDKQGWQARAAAVHQGGAFGSAAQCWWVFGGHYIFGYTISSDIFMQAATRANTHTSCRRGSMPPIQAPVVLAEPRQQWRGFCFPPQRNRPAMTQGIPLARFRHLAMSGMNRDSR
jgi:hypothetical protein